LERGALLSGAAGPGDAPKGCGPRSRVGGFVRCVPTAVSLPVPLAVRRRVVLDQHAPGLGRERTFGRADQGDRYPPRFRLTRIRGGPFSLLTT